MDLKKCEHCGNMFWCNTGARLCPLCAVVEKAKERTSEVRRESNDRRAHPRAA
jgi:uncharacterized Zn finger protein (UPF0148 family)